MVRQRSRLAHWILCCAMITLATGASPLWAAEAESSEPHDFVGVVGKSLTGDVYDASRWSELTLGTFFSEGWNQAWASGPAGEGGAPRQGWMNAQDGVFYRLSLATFAWADDHGSDDYAGGLTTYTPLNRRFQVRWDLPFVVSDEQAGGHRETSFGDIQITPRFMLSESQNFSQSIDLTFRTPTGSDSTGTDVGAFSPWYNFWYNPVGGLVLRGGAGGFVPFEDGASDAFNANVAAGYYFTPHDLTPVGDLVGYVSVNLTELTNHANSESTTVTFTPGFRTHLGANFYLLGGVELPATHPEPFDYQVLSALMKVW